MKKSVSKAVAEGWEERKFGDCARLINGRAYSQEELLDAGTPVIRIQNLNGGDRWYYSNLNLPDDKYCQSGDLLFAWSASFGPYIWRGGRSIFHYHIWRIVPNDCLDKAFAFRLLEWVTESVKSASHGVAMLHMTKGGMEAWPISLPSLPEQRRIAAILDQADALRAKRREALAQLDSLTQSIFIEMFGDPESNPKGLPITNLEDLCTRVTDGTHQSPKWESTGIPFLFISNIVNGEISYNTDKFISRETYSELTRRCPIQAGDVLFTTVGSYGNTAVVWGDREFCFQRHIAHVKPNAERLDPQFCAAMLQSPGVRRQVDKAARGVAQKTVNLADLKALRVFAPPLENQRIFTARLEVLKSIKGLQGQSQRELDTLFATIQHRAFRGEL